MWYCGQTSGQQGFWNQLHIGVESALKGLIGAASKPVEKLPKTYYISIWNLHQKCLPISLAVQCLSGHNPSSWPDEERFWQLYTKSGWSPGPLEHNSIKPGQLACRCSCSLWCERCDVQIYRYGIGLVWPFSPTRYIIVLASACTGLLYLTWWQGFVLTSCFTKCRKTRV